MPKNVVVIIQSWKDGSGSAASSFQASVELQIIENAVIVKSYLCNVTDMFLSLDKQNNAFFIYYQNHKLYQWTLGDTYNGNSISTAELMFNNFRGDLTA